MFQLHIQDMDLIVFICPSTFLSVCDLSFVVLSNEKYLTQNCLSSTVKEDNQNVKSSPFQGYVQIVRKVGPQDLDEHMKMLRTMKSIFRDMETKAKVDKILRQVSLIRYRRILNQVRHMKRR